MMLAHPDSPAAVIHRPQLGRPAHQDGRTSTEADSLSQTSPSKPVPDPTSVLPTTRNKQNTSTGRDVRNIDTSTHATSNPTVRGSEPALRPVRSTRNPNPVYVESIQRPWSASDDEIKHLNALISAGKCTFC